MPNLTRVVVAAAALLIATAISLSAQFEIGVFGGAHVEPRILAERYVRYPYPNDPPAGTQFATQVNDKGTGAAMGMVAGFALSPVFRLELQVWTSRNNNWRLAPAINGRVPAPNEVIPGFHIRKTIINPRITVVPLIRSRLELRVSGGLARVSRSGSGQSGIEDNSTMGGALTGGALVSITKTIVLAGELSFLAYSGRYPRDPAGSGGPEDLRPTTRHSDWVATLGLRARFGRRPPAVVR